MPLSSSPPALRPRVATSDLIPILTTGIAGGVLIIASDRAAAAIGARPDDGRALSMFVATALGMGLALVLAGMQGRAAELTLRRAVLAWLKLAVVAAVVLLATGRLVAGSGAIRAALIIAASLGVSLLLFYLRKRQA